MWHNVEIVALNRRLDKEKLMQFAKDSIIKDTDKYHLHAEYGEIFVQTFYCDQLVDDFKKSQGGLAPSPEQSD